jgi:hypothetical protein
VAGFEPAASRSQIGSISASGEVWRSGVGKSALLDNAVERAEDLQIVRTVAVES